jgi:hypothetical protein
MASSTNTNRSLKGYLSLILHSFPTSLNLFVLFLPSS